MCVLIQIFFIIEVTNGKTWMITGIPMDTAAVGGQTPP
jgi:hypothetical protein